MKSFACGVPLAACIAFGARADFVLSSCNFDSFTPGLLTAAANGTTPGQGDWFAFTSSTSSPAANFNVANDPAAGSGHGLCLSITGGTTLQGNNGDRAAWTNNVHDSIGLRGPGEDVVVSTFEMYVGGLSTSKNRVGAVLLDPTGAKTLSGLYLQANTRQLYIASYATSGSTTGNTVTSLGSGAVLQLNAWYTFMCAFDMATGQSQAGFFNSATGSWNLWTVNGAAAGTLVDRCTLQSLVNTSSNNSAGAAIGYFDNVSVYATPAPGAAPLLALAGILGGWRRRRN